MRFISLLIIIAAFVLPVPVFSAESELLLKQGIEAFNSGNYGSAELIFRRLKDTKDDEYLDRAWFYLARSIYHQKEYKSALYEFNSFLNKCSSTEQCMESRFWMAESYYNLGDYVKAIEQYNRYILGAKKGDLVAAAHDRIGSIYFSQMRYDEAILEWEEAIKISNDRDSNALRLLNIGEALFKNNRYDDALNRLAPLLTSQSNIRVGAMARLICGQIFQMQNDHKKALLVLNGIPGNLLNESPFIEAQYFKGVSNLALGAENTAKSLFELFILVGKDSPWYYNAVFELGSILSEGKDWKKAVVMLEEVRKSSPKPELRYQSSKLLSKIYMDRDPEAAIPYLEESLSEENKDEHKEALLILARIYMKTGDCSKALSVIEEYFSKYPYDNNMDEAVFIQAVIQLEQGNENLAMELLQKIQREYPFSRFLNESHFYLARVHFRKGAYRDTVSSLKKYLSLPKIEKKYEAYQMLVNSYSALNDYKNANSAMYYLVNNFSEADGIEKFLYTYAMNLYKKKINAWGFFSVLMKKYPESTATMDLYYFLGNDYYDRSDYSKAIYYYSLHIKGENSTEKGTAFFKKLLALMQLKKYADIIDSIQQGTVPPMNEEQWKEIPLLLSRSYYYTGNLEKTYNIMYSTDLGKYSKDDLMIFIRAALSVEDTDSVVEASSFLKDDAVMYAESLYLLGNLYRDREQHDKALGVYNTIATECPGAVQVQPALLETAKIQYTLKQYPEAMKTLESVSSRALQIDKNALMILIHFNRGEYDPALSLTSKNLSQLKKSGLAEGVFKKNMEYYYDHDKLKEFNQYAQYVTAYPGNEPYVLYLSGMIYYKAGYFKSAFQSFNRLSRLESEYTTMSLFYLGLLTGTVYNNKKGAIAYFEKLLQKEDVSEVLSLKTKINLAIILFETKRDSEAYAYLKDVIASSNRGYLKTQAQNLFEYYQKKEEADEQN